MKTFWMAMLVGLLAVSCSSTKKKYYDSSRSDAVCYRYHTFSSPSIECLHIN